MRSAAARPRRCRTRAQIQHALPGGQPLPRDGLQQFQVGVIMRGPDVLDLPRPAMAGVHDLHRDGARCRPDRPHIRHRATLRPLTVAVTRKISAGIPAADVAAAYAWAVEGAAQEQTIVP
jgi:hypothetical protein